MTITYYSTLDKDKDFQNVIDEQFRGISKQIKCLQKALANYRHDFSHRLLYLAYLISLKHISTVRICHQNGESCTCCHLEATRLLAKKEKIGSCERWFHTGILK